MVVTAPPADRRRGPARLEAPSPRALAIDDPDYPAQLRDLPDPPGVLYVRGVLPPRDGAVAIVGSRAATPYGRARAHELARDLARAGLVVVSGLARGIDAEAHAGALAVNGASVAVLPGGLDHIAPRHHLALAEALLARGGLATEWASGRPRSKGVFVSRNRIVAALAGATVVVEAAAASGALLTAGFARSIGRPVLAVPGDVDRPTSRGVHALLRSGAHLCECAADVIAVLGGAQLALPVPERAEPSGACGAMPPASAPLPARIRAALDTTPATIDVIAARAGADAGETLAALLAMTWAGLAVSHPGQRWCRAAANDGPTVTGGRVRLPGSRRR